MNPIAKRDGLLVEKVGDEIVVLDQVRNRAHRLNRTMASVWRHCDGKHSPAALLGVLHTELNFQTADDQVVKMALGQLKKISLIDFDPPHHDETVRFSRRELARKLAVATAVLPAILSITVPKPAEARSTSREGSSSSSSKDHNSGRDNYGSGESHFDRPDRYFGDRDDNVHDNGHDGGHDGEGKDKLSPWK
jgi:hypothetical protein